MINKKVSFYVSLGKYSTFSINRPLLPVFLSGFLFFLNLSCLLYSFSYRTLGPFSK